MLRGSLLGRPFGFQLGEHTGQFDPRYRAILGQISRSGINGISKLLGLPTCPGFRCLGFAIRSKVSHASTSSLCLSYRDAAVSIQDGPVPEEGGSLPGR